MHRGCNKNEMKTILCFILGHKNRFLTINSRYFRTCERCGQIRELFMFSKKPLKWGTNLVKWEDTQLIKLNKKKFLSYKEFAKEVL